jgi:catechol 2,3-dioxygenase-like lactoylglutathione lyase family enzyme
VSVGIAPDGAERARTFYGGVLGLDERPLPEAVDPTRFLWFHLGDRLDLHLHVLDSVDPPAVRDHFCVVVDEPLETLRARLADAGVETDAPAERIDARCFYCRDPFGNLIEFAERAE